MLALQFNTRSNFGKGSAKKLRKEGFVPCVITSSELGSISVSLEKKVVEKIIQSPAILATVFEVQIEVEGKKKKINVLPTKIDFHPVNSFVLHIDFLHVIEKQILAQVPVKIINSDKAIGLKKGGKLNLVKYHVPLMCDIKNIPSVLEVSIAGFGVGRSLFLSSIALPKGVKMAYDCLILSITGRGRKEKGEEEAAQTATATTSAATVKAAPTKPSK